MSRARTVVDDVRAQAVGYIEILRQHTDGTPEAADALAGIECFVDVALRLMAKTNPSKVRDIATIVEIKARMDGKPETAERTHT